jgi:uncharacterized protein YceK
MKVLIVITMLLLAGCSTEYSQNIAYQSCLDRVLNSETEDEEIAKKYEECLQLPHRSI